VSPQVVILDTGQIIRCVNGSQSGYCCDAMIDPITGKVFRAGSVGGGLLVISGTTCKIYSAGLTEVRTLSYTLGTYEECDVLMVANKWLGIGIYEPDPYPGTKDDVFRSFLLSTGDVVTSVSLSTVNYSAADGVGSSDNYFWEATRLRPSGGIDGDVRWKKFNEVGAVIVSTDVNIDGWEHDMMIFPSNDADGLIFSHFRKYDVDHFDYKNAVVSTVDFSFLAELTSSYSQYMGIDRAEKELLVWDGSTCNVYDYAFNLARSFSVGFTSTSWRPIAVSRGNYFFSGNGVIRKTNKDGVLIKQETVASDAIMWFGN